MTQIFLTLFAFHTACPQQAPICSIKVPMRSQVACDTMLRYFGKHQKEFKVFALCVAIPGAKS